MPIAVEIEFDSESEKLIKQIWQDMSKTGVSDFLYHSKSIPHITLGVFDDDIDKAMFIKDVKEFCHHIKKADITLSSIGIFNDTKSVLFLAATVTKRLINLHEKFFKHMEKYKDHAWAYYLPKTWVPHVTVAINVTRDRIEKGIDVLLSRFKPITVKVNCVGIINVKPLKHIDHIKIK